MTMMLCLLAALLLSAVVISARVWMATDVQPQSGDATVTLRGTGFEPFELVHVPGQFNLKINNQSGAEQLTLRLYKRNQREAEMDVTLSNANAELTVPLNLAAGDYSLIEANNPAWLLYVKVR
jgi:ABC-type amino acid transport substrate-binding protein